MCAEFQRNKDTVFLLNWNYLKRKNTSKI